MQPKKHCQVILTDARMTELGKPLEPFLQKGARNQFIEGKAVHSDGGFLIVTTMFEDVSLWIPMHFVACVGIGVNEAKIGF